MSRKHSSHALSRPCVAGTLLLLLTACGGAPDSSAPVVAQSGSSGDIDACKMLAVADPAVVLGEAHDGGAIVWQSQAGGMAVSQCQYTSTSSKRGLGLMVRRAPGSQAPASRQALIDQTRSSDDLGTGEDSAKALEAGKQIAGLGDLAVTYDLFTYNLMVWRGHDQFTVMLDGFGAGAEAEQRAVQVAKTVLSQL